MIKSAKGITSDEASFLVDLYEACENYEEVNLIRNYLAEEIQDKKNVDAKKKQSKTDFENMYLIDRCD